MKKLITFSLFLAGISFIARADHITGGEMYYTFTGISNGMYQYDATMKLYMRCNSGRSFNDPTIISVFDKANGIRVMNLFVPLSSSQNISLTNPDPCISNPPDVCYEIGYYNFTLSLPGLPGGYIVAGQVNYRIDGISNLTNGYNQIGATYTAEIPGTSPVENNAHNNSARFTGSDLVIVCANNAFSYSFAATDPDGGDQLKYYFCEAYRSSSGGAGGGGGGGGGNATAPRSPPYESVPYGGGFNGSTPLGNSVQVDLNTGLITGIAPSSGVYVVTVCVQEIRNGVVIATQRKDLQINVASCSLTAAVLLPEYPLCGDTKTIMLSNLSTSSLINSYYWEFKNAGGAIVFSTTSPTVTYTFPDTGIYSIKLAINRDQACTDSTVAIARVYPGLKPDFDFEGICFTKPTLFTDATTTIYGSINSWHWDFGDNETFDDTSSKKDIGYTYSFAGTANARLIVTTSKGCIDTAVKSISIVDKPPLLLAFRDTLICVPDKVQLGAEGSGSFIWTPNVNIINSNTASPIVSPTTTTTYYADMNDNGCLNRDSVKVEVTDHVNLEAMKDTIICRGDAIQLRIVSNGFQYSWTPALQLSNANIANPIATTNTKTIYEVTANIGSCTAKDQVSITTVPYPLADAGTDTVICFKTFTQLQGHMDGSSFNWSPSASLNNAAILNPIARPGVTTQYILTAYDTKGCPKPGTDTVLVNVLPAINPNAGPDLSVVTGQPVQMHATGGVQYLWLPSTGLSNANIANPTALYHESYDKLQYQILVSNEAGCIDTAFLTVKVFSTVPTVFVPTAFTPNGDGKNDILKPIAAGMQRIEHFNVYNRWGQVVFTTNANDFGWDGRTGGQPQQAGVYVWMVKAVDYLKKTYVQKGTVTLIR